MKTSIKSKLFIIPMLAVALAGGAAAGISGIASASTSTNTATQTFTDHGHRGMGPGIVGTVSAVNGDSLTVAGKNGTTYTVDVTTATVMKSSGAGSAPTTVAISDIAVGDTIMAQGTVSGTSVTATNVMDGQFFGGPHGGPGGMGGVMGTVSAVNGTTITVTGQNGGTYTVDASSATVNENGSTSSLSNVKVGDTVRVGGSITTASMTATNIDDGIPQAPAQATGTAQ
ncbi:MAG: hypothetical protein KGH79_00665 [Patescibacteria group bacterium]|nr:hypothetical protein [Patescibacteria group bacterium]